MITQKQIKKIKNKMIKEGFQEVDTFGVCKEWNEEIKKRIEETK